MDHRLLTLRQDVAGSPERLVARLRDPRTWARLHPGLIRARRTPRGLAGWEAVEVMGQRLGVPVRVDFDPRPGGVHLVGRTPGVRVEARLTVLPATTGSTVIEQLMLLGPARVFARARVREAHRRFLQRLG